MVIHDDLPKHISKVVAPLVEQHRDLLPTWCHSLSIVMTNEPCRAACESRPEYRGAQLQIGSLFMNDPDDERENTIVHEFIHVTLSPLDQLAYDLSPKHEQNQEAAEMAHEAIRRALEGVVSDFMRYMGRPARFATDDDSVPEPPKRHH
jgi:hypothetical protein